MRMFHLEWDLTTDRVKLSPECVEVLGPIGSSGHWNGADYLERIHPDDRAGYRQAINALLPTRSGYCARYRVINAEGREQALEERGLGRFDEHGHLKSLTSIVSERGSESPTQPVAGSTSGSTDGFLRKILDASLNGLYVYDFKKGKNTFINARYTDLTGYTLAGLNAMATPEFLDLFHPNERPAVLTHMAALREADDDTLLEIEYRFRRSDGEWIWCLSSDSVFERDTDGSVRSIMGTFIDVSSRRQATDALATSQALFQAIFENAAVGIAQVSLDGRFVRFNRRLAEITGYHREELAALRFQDITHPDDLVLDLDQAHRLLAGEIAAYRMEKRYIRKDGSAVWVKLTGSMARSADGAPSYFIAIIDDISARREAETRARTLAKVVETSGDFIGVAGLDGYGIYLNRAGLALVGLEDEAAVARTTIEEYLFPEDLPFVRSTVMPTVLREGRWAGDFRFRHFSTGESIDVFWDVVRIDDPTTGEPAKFATVTRDMRAQKAHEAALYEANRRKDEFLAVMGHELRNPMAPIRNAVDILKLLNDAVDPRATRALDILDRQTAHLGRLLDDLLDVARIARGQLKLERRPVKLSDILQQAADGALPLMEERRHHLEVEAPPLEILVEGDPVRLTQILLNLLLNAANYTQEGGRIRIATETSADQVVISVSDNGPGLAPDILKGIFQPFSSGGASGQQSPAGLGLGLTISRRLAELHDGHLDATSNWPQCGSEFRLHLPRPVPPRIEPEPDVQARNASPAAGARVLVVDDNTDASGALAMLLQMLGHTTETARTGEEALAITADWCPRLALLDIGLPDMDGLELARRLRARCPNGTDMLLVAVTGFGHDEARQRSLAAGFDDHLAKPVDHQTLKALLDRLD